MTSLSDLSTPALVLDRRRLAANCARMKARLGALGARLRPHMKTLKSVEAARLAVDPGHGGVAAATLTEVESLSHAFDDIQYAVCISPGKLERAVALARRVPRLSLFVDSLEAARAARLAGAQAGLDLNLWIEIDSGEGRTGIAPHDATLIALAAEITAGPGSRLAGVATHAGQAYGAADAAAIVRIAEDERRAAVAAADRLRRAGYVVEGVSVGSSPTAAHMVDTQGLTEIRAGVYMAGDATQVGLGVLGPDDVAVTVLASVISRDRSRLRIVVDAGGLALSKDTGDGRSGYGWVCDLRGRRLDGPVLVSGLHQEHGEIGGLTQAQFDALPIGARLRILPNHVCMTAAMYDRYAVVEDDLAVLDVWSRTNGWS